jgi:ribonucrease Y
MFNIISRIRSVVGGKNDPKGPIDSPVKAKKKPVKKDSVKKQSVSVDIVRKKELELVNLLEEANSREKELDRKRASLDEKETYLRKKEQSLEDRQRSIAVKQDEAEALKLKQLKTLEQIATLSKEEAQKKIVEETEKRLSAWLSKKTSEVREAAKSIEDEAVKEAVIEAIRHGVTDYVAEFTISTVDLPNEDVKGKIIGREGRNIRAFEKATGVELELGDGNEIRISSFDSVRREIAKIALQKLVRDGRIQPVKIEEVVRQTKLQMDKILLEEGKRICQAVGVYHLPIDIVKTIGKFKYRSSYGQNLASHTIEVTKIAIALASEHKADVKVVRLAGLLHDIGKVITSEEGSHIQIGVDFLRRYKFPQPVIDAVGEHHEDKPFSSLESVIVYIADAASGSRPGARYQAHEDYLKRMTSIEEVVRSFKGIDDVSAYQAGREIRVIVRPEEVSDEEMEIMVQKIAEKLDEESKWAGQVKITAIRETRANATAPVRR